MCLKKKEYPLQKTKGSIQWSVGLFFLLFLLMLLAADLQVSRFMAASLYLEDALAASNLASAVIDVEEYGISRRVRITDVVGAFRIYQQAMRENLQLNENWENSGEGVIAGPVRVENYTVYNVDREKVTIHSIDKSGKVHVTQGTPGSVLAPNGTAVEYTGIYSEISFPVKGLWGITVTAHKGKLVDIVSNAEEGSDTE